MKSKYKQCRYNGKRMRLHIAVWTSENGSVPKGFCIHHIDFNRENNSITNLTCISIAEHNKLHAAKKARDNKGRFINE